MAYIGANPQVSLQEYLTIDDISGSFNGTLTSFALLVGGVAPVPGPKQSNQLLISLNGVIQEPDDTGSAGFRLSGGNIIFSSAPASSTPFFGVVLAGADYVYAGTNFPDGSVTSPSITFANDLDSGFYRTGSGELAYTSNGTFRLKIDSSGRLGLGTSAPVDKLQVVDGDITVTTGSSFSGFTSSRATTPSGLGFELGRVNFDAYSTGTTYVTGAKIQGVSDGAWSASSAPSYLSFLTTSSGSTSPSARMVIKSDGKVGIGITSPVTTLDVVGGAIAVSGGLASDLTNRLALENSSNLSSISSYGATAGTGALRFITGGGGGSGGAERARIDSSGRLLVGTNTSLAASSQLQIEGTSFYTGGASLRRNSNDAGGTALRICKSRGTSNGSYSVVAQNDTLGIVQFCGADGNTDETAAEIRTEVDGVPGDGDMPGRLVFYTTANESSTPTERMRIASSGYVQISTSGDGYATVFSANANGDNYISQGTSGSTIFRNTSNAEYARIDSSGRLLVGTASDSNAPANCKFVVSQSEDVRFLTAGYGLKIIRSNVPGNGAGIGRVIFVARDGGSNEVVGANIAADTDSAWSSGSCPTRLVFSTTDSGASSPTERMRIDSGGFMTVLTTDYGVSSETTQGAGTSYFHFRGRYGSSGTPGSGVQSFLVWSNGNVQNTNNSYTAISDVKLKENIVDANPQWDDIKALQVRNYNLKEGQTHTQIGVVAQEVELISPGLVYESPDLDDEGNDLGTVTKSVNYSVLYMKAVKALQEAMERIETLEQRLSDAGIA